MYSLIKSHARRKAIKGSTVTRWESTGFENIFFHVMETFQNASEVSQTHWLPGHAFVVLRSKSKKTHNRCLAFFPFEDRGFGCIFWVLCLVLDPCRGDFCSSCSVVRVAESDSQDAEHKLREHLRRAGRVGNTVEPDSEQLLHYISCPLKTTPPSMLSYLFCFSIVPLLLYSFHNTSNVCYSVAIIVWLKIELDVI